GAKGLAVAEHDDIGRLRQIGQARVADEIADRLVFGVHRVDRSGKADGAERLDDGTGGARAIRGSDDRDRTRLHQRIKLHALTSGRAVFEKTTRATRRAAPRPSPRSIPPPYRGRTRA